MKQTAVIKNIVTNSKIYIYLVTALIAGITMMIVKLPSNKNLSQKTIPAESTNIVVDESRNIKYESNEYKLINILKKVEGVGDVDIIINYVSNGEKVPLVETSSENSKIINKTEGAKSEPYIITELNPEIEGVVVACTGGGNIEISNILKTTVSTYLGVPMHKINVLKMK